MNLLSSFNPRSIQHFRYNQGCTSSVATLRQFDGFDHQLKWDVGGPGLPQDRLPWGSPGSSRTLHLRGAHTFLSRQLAWPSHIGITLRHHCRQVSQLGHPGLSDKVKENKTGMKYQAFTHFTHLVVWPGKESVAWLISWITTTLDWSCKNRLHFCFLVFHEAWVP